MLTVSTHIFGDGPSNPLVGVVQDRIKNWRTTSLCLTSIIFPDAAIWFIGGCCQEVPRPGFPWCCFRRVQNRGYLDALALAKQGGSKVNGGFKVPKEGITSLTASLDDEKKTVVTLAGCIARCLA